jgi:hypothetical protein
MHRDVTQAMERGSDSDDDCRNADHAVAASGNLGGEARRGGYALRDINSLRLVEHKTHPTPT